MILLAGLFVASNAVLAEVLPGWKKAAPLLETPVTKEVIHPLTGESLGTIETRVNPEQPSAAPGAAERPDLVRANSIDVGNLDVSEIQSLGEVMMQWESQEASDEVLGRGVLGPPNTELVVFEVPPSLVAKLALLEPGDVTRVGVLWAEREREDAATVESEWLKAQLLGIPDNVWVERLQQLVQLASQARSRDQGVYLWLSP